MLTEKQKNRQTPAWWSTESNVETRMMIIIIYQAPIYSNQTLKLEQIFIMYVSKNSSFFAVYFLFCKVFLPTNNIKKLFLSLQLQLLPISDDLIIERLFFFRGNVNAREQVVKKSQNLVNIPCGPSIMDYPETSGNLRKPAAKVTGRFSGFFYYFFF